MSPNLIYIIFNQDRAIYAPASKVTISGSWKTIIKHSGVLLSGHSHLPRPLAFKKNRLDMH